MNSSGNKRFLYSYFILILCGFLHAGCDLMWKPNSPKEYMVRRPVKMILDKKLNEISGINYIAAENTLIAIADDKKKIYKLSPEGKEGDYYDPELPSQDFEDVVKVGNTVYTLVSNGDIFEINKVDSGYQTNTHKFKSEAKNDFETLYYDSSQKALIILCKSCAFDKGHQQRSAFRFYTETKQFDRTPYYAISTESVQDALKDGKADFNPSAAAINPIDKRLYILASSGNLMVISDLKGKVSDVFRLNPTFFPQAEGISFAPNGDMYVSNEAKLGKPTLLKIAYKPHVK